MAKITKLMSAIFFVNTYSFSLDQKTSSMGTAISEMEVVLSLCQLIDR